MAAPTSAPSNVYLSTANANNFLSWSILTGADAYVIQRSFDGVNFTTLTTIGGVPLPTSYLDTAVTAGVKYYYQVAGQTASATGPYSTAQLIITATPGEMSLGQVRLMSQQRADLVNSNFVTVIEWNDYIRLACYELYDILISSYEDYYIGTPVQFNTATNQQLYPLPDGLTTFTNGTNPTTTFVAPKLYKLRGVDLGLNASTSGVNNNGWVSVPKFMFADRNKYFYPNTGSTIYGVFNLSYRMIGSNIEFIPPPSNNQPVRLWYIPALTALLQDTDLTSYSISGWIYYVILRAAKYALDKEESDTSGITQEILFLKQRIEAMTQNRDAGQPDTISDTRSNYGKGGWSYGGQGFGGGL